MVIALGSIQVIALMYAASNLLDYLSSDVGSAAGASESPLGAAVAVLVFAGLCLAALAFVDRAGMYQRVPVRSLSWRAPAAAWGVSLLTFVFLGLVTPHFAQMSSSGQSVVAESVGWIGVINAFQAGIREEIFYVGVPVCLGLWLASLLTSTKWRTVVLTGAVGVGSLCRAAGHLYQSETHALVNLLLGVTLAVVFLWWRSLWPLMICHIAYDLVVFLCSGSMQKTLLMALGVVALVAIAVTIGRRVVGPRGGSAGPPPHQPMVV